jgi:hypothetical protein
LATNKRLVVNPVWEKDVPATNTRNVIKVVIFFIGVCFKYLRWIIFFRNNYARWIEKEIPESKKDYQEIKSDNLLFNMNNGDLFTHKNSLELLQELIERVEKDLISNEIIRVK